MHFYFHSLEQGNDQCKKCLRNGQQERKTIALRQEAVM